MIFSLNLIHKETQRPLNRLYRMQMGFFGLRPMRTFQYTSAEISDSMAAISVRMSRGGLLGCWSILRSLC